VSADQSPVADPDRTAGPRIPLPDLTSPLRDVRVTARVGRALGVAVTVCLTTGLLSHLHQHPVGWLPIPPAPSWGYRLTQGLHVAAGIGCVPLVLVKLFSVYPRLLEWPPIRSVRHALERLSVAVLVASMLFEIVTGLLNVAQWYPWAFFFPRAHYAMAWALGGAVLLHLAVKWPVIVEALRRRLDDGPQAALSRRDLLRGTAMATGAVTVVTIGQTFPGLGRLALLAPRRPDVGPQGLPVNRTADSAQVRGLATAAGWALDVDGPQPLRLSRAELEGLTQVEVDLPIACVEGWSAQGRWGGVRLRDVLALAGLRPDVAVRVRSLEPRGLYTSSLLTADQARHRDTVLALRLNGSDLAIDHGFPLRLIAGNRPGVLQTKWLARIEAV
jgi:DMSO/TMAO reductase YedYZ molybdopterin-dependent catalytic subunit